MENKIQEIINTKIDYLDREAAERKLNDCINMIGYAAKNVALRKGELERAKAVTLRKHPELNSRLIKMRIDASTVDEAEALELAERLWAGLHKTIDGLKSLLNVQEKNHEITWGNINEKSA